MSGKAIVGVVVGGVALLGLGVAYALSRGSSSKSKSGKPGSNVNGDNGWAGYVGDALGLGKAIEGALSKSGGNSPSSGAGPNGGNPTQGGSYDPNYSGDPSGYDSSHGGGEADTTDYGDYKSNLDSGESEADAYFNTI